MTLPVSGAISFNAINVELGVAGATQASLGQASYRALAGVASGAISMSNFYGKANQFAFTIAANQTNANLRTLAINAGWNQSSQLIATINAGIYISSNGTGTPALTISGSFPNGVQLTNNGIIVGRGGNGGAGRGFSGFTPVGGSSGAGGGGGLSVSSAVSIQNNGTIAGGGGGGGGGNGILQYYNESYYTTAGGGGGGGRSSAAANSSGGGGGGGSSYNGASGGGGTVSAAGGGGAGGGTGSIGFGENGGGGGGWGTAGAGTTVFGGGAGGYAVSGNGNVTWTATGTRLGSIG